MGLFSNSIWGNPRVDHVVERPSIGRVSETPAAEFRSVYRQLRGMAKSGQSLHGPLPTAKALKGQATIIGPRASEVAGILDNLYRRSPTFRSWIVKSRGAGKLFTARTTVSDDDSFATRLEFHSTVYLNLAQARGTAYGVTGLVIHEFGHAAGNYVDGKPGQAGTNQYAQARVLKEIGLGKGEVYPYGQDLGGPGTKAIDRV